MHNIEPNFDAGYQKQKRTVLLIALAFNLVSTAISLNFEKPPYDQIVAFLTTIGYGLLILWWCKIDSEQRNIDLGAGFRFLLIIFGIFALIAYLFKSRGFKKGLIAVGYTLLFILGAFIINTFLVTLFMLIFAKDL